MSIIKKSIKPQLYVARRLIRISYLERKLSGKKEPVGGKRRVKSARRAGKSVSFVDEKSESDAPEVAAIELVPKEDIAVKVVSRDQGGQHSVRFFTFHIS